MIGILLAASLSGCVMKRTVTHDGAVVSQGYVVERPLETLHNLETTGPDEDDD
jgi:cytochrome c biogenesis protein ResB